MSIENIIAVLTGETPNYVFFTGTKNIICILPESIVFEKLGDEFIYYNKQKPGALITLKTANDEIITIISSGIAVKMFALPLPSDNTKIEGWFIEGTGKIKD